MQCPDCGYMLSAFDKTCPRCENMKKRTNSDPSRSATPEYWSAEPENRNRFLLPLGILLCVGICVFAWSIYSSSPKIPVATNARQKPVEIRTREYASSVSKPVMNLQSPPTFSNLPANGMQEANASQEMQRKHIEEENARLSQDNQRRLVEAENARIAQEQQMRLQQQSVVWQQEQSNREQLVRQRQEFQKKVTLLNDLREQVIEYNSLLARINQARSDNVRAANSGRIAADAMGRSGNFAGRMNYSGVSDREAKYTVQRIVTLRREIIFSFR